MGKCRNAKGMSVAWSWVLNTSIGIYCKFSFRDSTVFLILSMTVISLSEEKKHLCSDQFALTLEMSST